jgi:hypothetical protein
MMSGGASWETQPNERLSNAMMCFAQPCKHDVTSGMLGLPWIGMTHLDKLGSKNRTNIFRIKYLLI